MHRPAWRETHYHAVLGSAAKVVGLRPEAPPFVPSGNDKESAPVHGATEPERSAKRVKAKPKVAL